MIMMGLKFKGKVPFKEIYIHGLVRDAEGQKMSKSKGNVLDPIDVIDGIDLESLVQKRTSGMMQPHLAEKIEKSTRKTMPEGIPAFGTDALRFTFASLATTGRDIVLSMDRVEGYRNFCNKIWNAARYVLMNTEDHDCGQNGGDIELNSADQWIISRLQLTSESIKRSIETYRFDHAAQSIYEFTWNEYCDWYLELSKPVLNNEASTEAQLRGTRHTLIYILESLLKLAHPIMPFITEEIWQRVAALANVKGDTIMLQAFPQKDNQKINNEATEEIQWVMDFVLGIRKIRSGMNIKPGKLLAVLIQNASSTDEQRLTKTQAYLKSLSRVESITILPDEQTPESATALVGEMKVLIPMAGLINVDEEKARLSKEIEKIEKEVSRLSSKLANDNFTSRAPDAVVAKEREKLNEANKTLHSLQEQQQRIEVL